jgi:hypothetical protein
VLLIVKLNGTFTLTTLLCAAALLAVMKIAPAKSAIAAMRFI